jgi:hypothetical protein
MRSPRAKQIEAGGQDSFLDIVTNIVGILIILVMVIGARVQSLSFNTEDYPPAAEVTAIAAEVSRLEDSVVSSESELVELDEEAGQLAATVADAGTARIHLATAVSAAARGIESRKQVVDQQKVAAAEAAAKRKRLESEIEQCNLEAEGIAHAPQVTEKLLAYPTPIGRTVTGDEMHFQIAGGRVSYIPLTELFEEAKARTQRHSGSLASMQTRVETVGPVRGFFLDYVVEVQVNRSAGQVMVRSREWVARPARRDVGELLPDALARQSRFRTVLSSMTPATTVTLWCYPDSFEQYRVIREELHRLGVAAACRPLPEGAPIGGSAEGSKSVAQ